MNRGGGKSVTGFSIIKLIEEPGEIVDGQIIFEGEDLVNKSEKQMEEIRGKEISMIFQDPMTVLNPIVSIKNRSMKPCSCTLTWARARGLKLASNYCEASGSQILKSGSKALPTN